MSCGKAYIIASLLALGALAGCETSAHAVRVVDSQEELAARTAKDALRQGRFDVAATGFMRAFAISQDAALRGRYAASLAETYREWALYTSSVKKDDTSAEDLRQSIKLCNIAQGVDPANAGKYEQMIVKFQARIDLLKYRAIAKDEHLIPDEKPSYEKVAIFLEQAHAYVLAGDYIEAQKHFNKVLRIDASNATALQGLEHLPPVTPPPTLAMATQPVIELHWIKTDANAFISLPSAPSSGKSLRETIIGKIDFQRASLRDATAKFEAETGGAFKFDFMGFDPSSKALPLMNFRAECIPMDDALAVLCNGWDLHYEQGPDGHIVLFRRP